MKSIDKVHYISQQASDGSHLTAIQQALDAGCQWIQLRVKDQTEEKVLAYAIAAKTLCEAYSAKLIVNDYPEIALKAQVDGLHLGLDDMPISLARQIVGAEMIIGGTANTFDQVQQRVNEGADYVGLGPFRFTKTKEKLSPLLGLRGYQEILKQMKRANLDIPVIAIGGILPEDIKWLIDAGVHGVAVSAALTLAADCQETVRSIYSTINSAC
ncbi:MAG: thiamine phosphate synthase [Pedobacter sp.]